MLELVPSVMQILSEQNRLDEVILAFFQQIQTGIFPTDNIAFLLWTDVVRWYQCQNTTQMRYSSDSKMFWKLGWKLFGGRFVRFMGGFKNEAELVQEKSAKGKHSPTTSKVNFILPDSKVLRRFDPFNVDGEKQPGIYTDIMETISMNMKHQSACLTFDGKKLKQGLTQSSGDVDLLGFENGMSLDDRKYDLQMKQDEIDLLIYRLTYLNDENMNARQMPEEMRLDVIKMLLGCLKNISVGIQSVKDIKKKKEYCKLKLMERGGESNWRKGKYVYAISAIIAFIYDINEFLKSATTAVDTICRCVSFLNGAEYVTGSTVNLKKCSTYLEIQSDSTDIGNSRLIKQRSEKWFQIRSVAKVTGSTLFKALGLDGLQKQKEHFEKVVCNVPEKEPSPEAKAAMKHGTENELNGVATIVGKIMPVICPDVLFCEEGCVEMKGPDMATFMVVSPDGSLRTSSHLHSNKMAVEIKCPVYKIHTEFPARYMLQCLSEIEVLDVDSLLYVSWTLDETTVFKVERDSLLFQRAMRLALQLYGGKNPKKPSKISEETKLMKDEIISKSKKIEMIGQFPSVSIGIGMNEYAEATFTVEKMTTVLESLKEVTTQQYELTREKASEAAMVFLSSDLDRSWNREEIVSAPVAWFPKGYSLQTETLRAIADEIHTKCHEAGIHMPCQSFDGQWHTLVVRAIDGRPLTKLQLQKDVMKEVEQMRKPAIVSKLKDINREPRWFVEVLASKSGEQGESKVVLTASNGGLKLPELKLSQRRLLNKGSEKAQAEELRCEPTLADALPETIIHESDIAENIFSTVKLDGTTETEAFSSNIDEEGWLRELTDVSEQTEDATGELESVDNNRKDNIDFPDNVQVVPNEESDMLQVEKIVIEDADAEHILSLLRTDNKCNKKQQWNQVKVNIIHEHFKSTDNLNKLRDVEIRVIVRYLKKTKGLNIKESVSKQMKIHKLSQHIQALKSTDLEVAKKKVRKQKVRPLSELASSVLSKKVSKQVLNNVYAEFIWPDRLSQWITTSPLANKPTVDNTEVAMEWFYTPEFSQRRHQLEVRCIDSTHLLTRTRRKSCKGALDGVSNQAWIKVAKSKRTFLTPIMVEEITDPMSVSMAETHFSEAVENEMRLNGDTDAADLCKDIRNWWHAEDSPGISAMDRFFLRNGLRKRLLNKVSFSNFPPHTMYINDWPLQLWEAIVASIDAKTLLYPLCHRGSYNVRAFSSLIGETFFSELTLNDKRGQGTVTTQEFGQFIGTTIEQVQIRLNPERKFTYRTSKSTAYKLVEDIDEFIPEDRDDSCDACEERGSSIVNSIAFRNHFFDSEERRRLAGRKKEGTVSLERNSVQKGALGVRWNAARRNEAKMPLTKNMGIDD